MTKVTWSFSEIVYPRSQTREDKFGFIDNGPRQHQFSILSLLLSVPETGHRMSENKINGDRENIK